MKKTKRMLAFILSAIMLVTTISTTGMVAFAGDGFLGPNYKTSYNAADWTGKTVLTKETDYSADGKVNYVDSYSYNDAGFLTKNVTKWSDGDVYSKSCVYDSNNNLTKDTRIYSDGDKYTYSYTYNSKGFITKETSYNTEEGTETKTYSYNDAGYVSKQVDNDSYGKSTYTYTYNKSNKVLTKKFTGKYFSSTTTYTYDSKGRKIKIETVDSDGDSDIATIKYNDAGLVAKEYSESTYYDYDDDDYNTYWESNTYTYNSDKKLTKEVYKDSYGDSTTTEYTYKNGKLVKEASTYYYDGEYDETECTYTYDSKGNMISRYYSRDEYWDKYTYTYNSAGDNTKVVNIDSDGDGYTHTMSYNKTHDIVKDTYKDTDGDTLSTVYEYKTLSNTTCLIDDDIHLSYAKTTYNGKAKKPYVIVDDLLKGVDYHVVYSNNVKAGKGVATIKFNDRFTQKDINVKFDINKQSIPAKNVTLSKTAYTYDGNYKKPTVTVKNAAGTKLSSSNYTVKYSNNKAVGKATVTVTMKGNYSGTIKKNFNINPKGTSMSTLTATKGGFKATWKKQATQTTGYILQYSTSSSFSNYKYFTLGSNKTLSKSVTGLSKGKKYYVRVRTYKVVNGTKYYSGWSSAKAVTTKK